MRGGLFEVFLLWGKKNNLAVVRGSRMHLEKCQYFTGYEGYILILLLIHGERGTSSPFQISPSISFHIAPQIGGGFLNTTEFAGGKVKTEHQKITALIGTLKTQLIK